MTKARDNANNWAGDISAVTAGTGITGGGTSGDVTVNLDTTAVISPTIFDAKGDLISATAADTPARLAVGANGTVLTADSAETLGVKWATPGGTEKTYTLINTGGTALTGATTITVSGLGGYSSFFVLLKDASSATALSTLSIRPNGAAPSGAYAHNTISADPTYSFSNYSALASETASSITFARMGDGAAGQIQGAALIFGGATTGQKAFIVQGGQTYDASSDTQTIRSGFGLVDAGGEITSINVISSTGNFDNGTVYIYGAV